MKSMCPSPPDAECSQCLITLDTAGLKCMNCTTFVHLRCSGMPDYHLVWLALTQASFMCQRCVTGTVADDKYEAEVESISTIIEREKATIIAFKKVKQVLFKLLEKMEIGRLLKFQLKLLKLVLLMILLQG